MLVTLLVVLVLLVVVGVVLTLFNQYVNTDARTKNAVNVLVLLAAFIYVVLVLAGRIHFTP
jgi:hypothetical protein